MSVVHRPANKKMWSRDAAGRSANSVRPAQSWYAGQEMVSPLRRAGDVGLFVWSLLVVNDRKFLIGIVFFFETN